MAKGVGVSRELMEAVKRVFKAANAPVEFEELDMSGDDKENQEQMENLIYSVERNGVCIKGICTRRSQQVDRSSVLSIPL